MFSSYHNACVLPIRNFRQWHKKTDSGWLIPDLWIIFTPFCRVKNRQGFLSFIPNWLQIRSEKTARKGDKTYLNCLEADACSDTGESNKTQGLMELSGFYLTGLYNRLYDYFSANSILFHKQFGF